jgi:hypothetical protein
MAAHRNYWKEAQELPVVRGCPPYLPEDLEPGVKFFVLALEQMGCTTYYSCEGHPTGFYIVFSGEYETALAVARVGCLSVEVDHRQGWFMLSSIRNEYPCESPWIEADRQGLLTWAAQTWVKRFGRLAVLEAHRAERRRQARRRKPKAGGDTPAGNNGPRH